VYGLPGPHIYLSRWVAELDQRIDLLDPFSNIMQTISGEKARTRAYTWHEGRLVPVPDTFLSEDLLRAILYVSDWAYRQDEGGHGAIVINALAGLNHSGGLRDEHLRGFAVDFDVNASPWSPNLSISNTINVDNRVEIRDYLQDMGFITQRTRAYHWDFLTQQNEDLLSYAAPRNYVGDFRRQDGTLARSFHLSIWGRLPATPESRPILPDGLRNTQNFDVYY